MSMGARYGAIIAYVMPKCAGLKTMFGSPADADECAIFAYVLFLAAPQMNAAVYSLRHRCFADGASIYILILR